jgi:hypothetical protein
VNGISVQPAIEAAIHRIGVSERRRLSIIFQRDRPGMPEAGLSIHGRSCQSPRIQRCWREASTR